MNSSRQMQRCVGKSTRHVLATLMAGLVLTVPVLARPHEPQELPSNGTLPAKPIVGKTAGKDATSFVGFTLVADNYGSPVHDASLSERAMILDVRNGQTFEVAPMLRAEPRAITQFSQWLPGHNAAVVLRAYFPNPQWGASTDNNDIWFDEYLVDLGSGRFLLRQQFMPWDTRTMAFRHINVRPIPGFCSL